MSRELGQFDQTDIISHLHMPFKEMCVWTSLYVHKEQCVCVPRLHACGLCPVILGSGRWHFSPAPRPFSNPCWAGGLLASLDLCFCSPCLSPARLVSGLLTVLCSWLFANLFGYLLEYNKWERWRWLGIIILWWVNGALQQAQSDYKH